MPGMNLYRIADLSRVWIEAEIFEKDLSLIRLGQSARVSFEAYPGESFSALVTYVYPTVSVEARTGRIRMERANADLRLKPGMYASVQFSLPTKEAPWSYRGRRSSRPVSAPSSSYRSTGCSCPVRSYRGS